MATTAADTPTLRKTVQRFFRSEKTPKELAWVSDLSPLHFRLFVVDLHDALSASLIRDGNSDVLRRTLEEWQATAEVDANPDLARKLKTPRRRKKYLAWTGE